MNKPGWLGKDVVGGVASEPRPDRRPPAHWRLDAVYATARPHHLSASPDGETVAFVLDIEGTTDIWTVAVDTGTLTRVTTDRGLVAYWEDSAPVWSPDGSRLAYNTEGSAFVVPVNGGPSRRLGPGTVGAWGDDRHLLVSMERDRCSRLAVIEVDDPWPAPLGPKEGDVTRPVPLPDGRLLATFWPKEDLSRSDLVLIQRDGSWDSVVGYPGRRATGHVVGESGVAYLLEDGDRTAIYLMDLAAAGHHKLAGGDTDFSNLVWLPEGASLIAISSARGRSDLVAISDDGEVSLIAEGGSWQTPVLASRGVVAIHEATDSPPRIVLVESGGTRRVLYDPAPGSVRAAPHAKVERVTFHSTDGLEIEGFLFRPADTSAPVPAVVYPHGGPTDCYGEEWDGHAQYFVDKGYAWLAVNFRGSTGYGIGFERANLGDWGGGDVDDCIAAAQYLAGLDWVDRRRIGIYGPSYGSYMALASLVREDTPFACGVAKYGDSDVLTSWAQGDREGREELERMMGRPAENPAAYRAASPIHQIDRITKPILVAHGELDVVVHPKQSEELVAALDRIGATYEYITYPTEGHGLLRREPQIHFYQRLERFLDWYLM